MRLHYTHYLQVIVMSIVDDSHPKNLKPCQKSIVQVAVSGSSLSQKFSTIASSSGIEVHTACWTVVGWRISTPVRVLYISSYVYASIHR